MRLHVHNECMHQYEGFKSNRLHIPNFILRINSRVKTYFIVGAIMYIFRINIDE